MERRITGLIVAGLGAFSVAAAVTLLLVSPALIKVPLDQKGESVAEGSGLSVFYPKDLTEHTGITAQAVRKLEGQPDAPGTGPDVAVWSSGVVLTAADGTLITVTQQTACLDRRTGAAVNPCPAARIDGSSAVTLTGQQFTFPIGTQRQDHDFFDASAKAAFPARYVADEVIDGHTLYRFEQRVPETVVDRREVPGELAGAAAGSPVQADVVYSNLRTIWVEPTTGVIAKGSEQIDQFLRGTDGATGVTLLKGTLTFDDATVARQLAIADQNATRINMVRTIAPAALGALGVLLLVLAALLMRGTAARPPAHAARPLVPSNR